MWYRFYKLKNTQYIFLENKMQTERVKLEGRKTKLYREDYMRLMISDWY